MAKVSLAKHMREQRVRADVNPDEIGPFITISRQFGCYGFSLGLLLQDILNDQAIDQEHTWKIYQKEILAHLASETSIATDLLEKERRAKPKPLVNFFRSLSGEKIPSGHEIRNRITMIIRDLATEGHAIIIGQGGAGATADLPNGLSVRLEAPETWCVKQIAFREGLGETEAKLQVRAKERERNYLRKLYQARFPRLPAFNLVYDCSVFSLAQIAQHMAQAMKLKKLI